MKWLFCPVTAGEEAHLEQNPGHIKLVTEHNMSWAASTQTPHSLFYCSEYKQSKGVSVGFTGIVNEAEFVKLPERISFETYEPGGQL